MRQVNEVDGGIIGRGDRSSYISKPSGGGFPRGTDRPQVESGVKRPPEVVNTIDTTGGTSISVSDIHVCLGIVSVSHSVVDVTGVREVASDGDAPARVSIDNALV